MIDPLVSLAFSLQANKGAYALLIGSGVSRSSGVPTGWEITLELVRKIAAASGAEISSTAEEWFHETYNKGPDYSELLDQLCKTAAERQQYLKGFFEPSDQEREEGLKQPTAAHHAIAEMMAEGYVRVVVTTNFDRLLEQALEAKGIVPVVISNADQAQGMLPLVHQKHCVVKVHGDYLDTRIMNTVSELAAYPSEMDRLLDQVFDEFGMILCGWSGEWDPALRSAIARAPSRRFSSYWATRGDLAGMAQKLATDRGIVSIPIEGADSFFSKLSENLASLREFDRPHPLSVQSAVASLKRYLAEDRYRIRLHDLLEGAAGDVQARWKSAGLEMGSPPATDISIPNRVKSYDSSMEILLALGVELGRWSRPEHFQAVADTLETLCHRPLNQGSYIPLWQELSRYPATLYLYAVGLSALKAGNIELIGKLLSMQIASSNGKNEPIAALLPPMCLVDNKESLWPLYEGKKRKTPLSDWIESQLRFPTTRSLVIDQHHDPFSDLFDKFEMLISICYRALMRAEKDWLWVPPGCWSWRSRSGVDYIGELEAELGNTGAQSSLLRLGIFSKGASEALEVLNEVKEFKSKLPRW